MDEHIAEKNKTIKYFAIIGLLTVGTFFLLKMSAKDFIAELNQVINNAVDKSFRANYTKFIVPGFYVSTFFALSLWHLYLACRNY